MPTIFIPEATSECYRCNIPNDNHKTIPSKLFYEYLALFLNSKPSKNCPYGGHGKYHHLLRIQSHSRLIYMIEAFHSPLVSSEDHIRALESARNLCANLTLMARKYLGTLGLISEQDIQKFNVFPYSPFYVFYSQYVDIWSWTRSIIVVTIAAIFCVHFIVSGLNWLVSLSLILTVFTMGNHMIGMMYIFNIKACEMSLVFVVICMGFSPRFVILFIDRFAVSMQRLDKDRQANVVYEMGRPFLWGVIGNKLFWVAPMLMSGSNYLSLFIVMCVSGTFFGVLYVPTIIYFFGKLVQVH